MESLDSREAVLDLVLELLDEDEFREGPSAGLVLQVVLIACGYFHISLAILGVLFLLVWLYALSVRRSVLGK